MLLFTQCPKTLSEINDMKSIPYKAAVGSLMYTAIGTCPDIVFVVSLLGQFMHNLGKMHWMAAKCVLRYLKGSCELKLTYGGTSNSIAMYSDTDLASQEHKLVLPQLRLLAG